MACTQISIVGWANVMVRAFGVLDVFNRNGRNSYVYSCTYVVGNVCISRYMMENAVQKLRCTGISIGKLTVRIRH